jgi:hypothetical protein
MQPQGHIASDMRFNLVEEVIRPVPVEMEERGGHTAQCFEYIWRAGETNRELLMSRQRLLFFEVTVH